MRFSYAAAALAAVVLSACGNVNMGKARNEADAQNGLGKATFVDYASATTQPSNYSFGPCKALAVYTGSDPGFADIMRGAQACPSTNSLSVVKIKVSANFPVNFRVCVVPSDATMSYPETCFSINGEANVFTGYTSWDAVTLVRESDLAFYKDYLNGSSGNPPMAYGVVR